MKISAMDFKDFFEDYHRKKKYDDQRFGQAFCNRFLGGRGNQYFELFYEKNVHKAESYIWENLIDMGKVATR